MDPCDEDPLKWDLKNRPSLQFVNTDRMSLLSTLVRMVGQYL